MKQTTKAVVQQIKQTAKATVAQAKQQVKTVVKETKKAMVKVGGKVAAAYTSFKAGGYKEVLSVAADFIPVVGNVKAAYEAVVGKDPITGRKLEDWERSMSAAGILGGPAVKAVKHGGKMVAATVKTTSPVLAKNAEKLKDTLESITSGLSFPRATVQLASVNSAGNGLSLISPVGKSPKKQQPASINERPKAESEKQARGTDEAKLYNRSSFRKSSRVKAESEAPKNESGKMICPTCGKDIPDSITINTKKGPLNRIGYDLDHYPDTWAERVASMKAGEVKPTRKEVLDEYNKRLRVQCHECNISHAFEGVEGTYKGVKDDD